MTTLTTQICFIVFKDSSVKEITQAEVDRILDSESGKFQLQGGVYDMNMISKILTAQEYYEQYPDKRPVTYSEENYLPSPKPKRKSALQGILTGLESFIEENGGIEQMNDETKAMYRRSKLRIASCK